ncbi:hypothetical protein OF83DRAFT_1095505 [Amylostereum chailletii]|nr:hypothetical protein OF83DRAFT_1095505 [Amylostereum chailletii]
MDISSPAPGHPDSPTGIKNVEKATNEALKKYEEMIKSDFPGVVQTLRTLSESTPGTGNDDEFHACCYALFEWFGSFLDKQDGLEAPATAITSTDTIETLGDIIADPSLFRRPLNTVGVLFLLLSNTAFIAVQKKDSGIAKKLIPKGPAIWDNIWKNIELYEKCVGQATGHRDLNDALIALTFAFKESCQLCAQDRKEANEMWCHTRLPHVAFTAWFYSKPGNLSNVPDAAMLTFGGSEEESESQRYDVLRAFGRAKILQRLHQDFEDPTVFDFRLMGPLGTVLGFMMDVDFRQSLGPSQTFKAIITALRRQSQNGKITQIWWGSSGALLAGMAKENPFEMCLGPMIADCDYTEILSRALIALVPEGGKDLDMWCELIHPMGDFAYRCRLSRTDAEAPVFAALFSSLQKHWYSTLARLRTLQPKDGSETVKSRASRALYIWRELGLKVGLEETAERVRYESGDDYDGTVRYFCSRRECNFRDKEPPTPLMKCSGCAQAFYCNTKCQSTDWKTGGHKKMCKMLKNASAAGKTVTAGGVPAFGTLDVDGLD